MSNQASEEPCYKSGTDMRPPFLQCGGEDKFADYQTEFNKLLPSGLLDILGNEVNFEADRCDHICYKNEAGQDKRIRNTWRQDRAARIPWIREALIAPEFICVSKGTVWAYLLTIKQDRENGHPAELFAAFVNAEGVTIDRPDKVYFVTAYTISIQEWETYKKNRPWIYTTKPPKPPKSKKKK